MAGFDETGAYAPQEDVFFDDGREIELLHYVYSRPNVNQLRGSPSDVLEAIDQFARTRKYLMNVGSTKGSIITKLIAETKPPIMVELGGYVGYSAILFGDALKRAGGHRYVCLERNPEFAAVASSLIDLAGLAGIVQVIVGASDVTLQRLHLEGLRKIDFMFLDHYKPAYLPDLKLCEQLGLVQPDTVLAADNVIKPGNPPYLEYVRSTVSAKRQEATNADGLVGFDEKCARQYEKREGVEKLSHSNRGDPNLMYHSELVRSFEPTGVPDGIEVTRCVGRE